MNLCFSYNKMVIDDEEETTEDYLRGIFVAVVASCVIVVLGIATLCALGIKKARERQDTFSLNYDLKA